MKQTKKEEKKKKKEKKSEVEYRYIKLPMIFDGHIIYNYCTIMDYMENTTEKTEKQETFFTL